MPGVGLRGILLLRRRCPLPSKSCWLRCGAVDVVDRHGNTPLWGAVFCSRGEGGTIRLLLEAGADPDRHNVHGVRSRALAGRIAN
ncbi:hypothetical protein [Streptomyces sp. NEAU-H33]|uniref:hypothetical protein n=1 Tax=Streptomyces sp. NEAU-H33 TaxID=2979463 RepID=UPI003A1039DC